MGKYLDIANDATGLKSDTRGQWVEFRSPLYGACCGRLKEIIADTYILTPHSVQTNEIRIPSSWIIRIVDETAVTK